MFKFKWQIRSLVWKHPFIRGIGTPPRLDLIVGVINKCSINVDLKINIVLCPEILENGDLFTTLHKLKDLGIKRVNLRQPYGQPHIENPLKDFKFLFSDEIFGNPIYDLDGMKICLWDVHYTEVESVNLYANGNISTTYPVTKGYDEIKGKVLGQENFLKSGRVYDQWVG